MPGSLWTPEGMVSTRERGVQDVTREEIIILSKMHEVAQRLGITVVCKRCDTAFTGRNNDSPDVQTLSVECHCRQLRYTRGK